MSVSGQDLKSEEEKINILMYVMGEESEEIILQSTQKPETYVATLNCFGRYFIPRRNVIFERFKFNSRVQAPGESIETFITSLHTLAEHCEYGGLKDQLRRDRIVVGMVDVKTSEKLQLREHLTLAECAVIAKQAELQVAQSTELLGRQSQVNKISTNRRAVGSGPNEDMNEDIL